MTPERWEGRFRLFLLVSTGLRLIWAALPGLKYEEAYYWNYGQHLALSYFDHPPMVGWLIRLSTSLGGDHPFWVRLPAVLLFAVTLWAAHALARQTLDSPRAGLAVAVLMSALPIFGIYSLVVLPDAPLLCCWTLGCLAGWRLVTTGDPRRWWAVGLWTGLGMLSKYPAALIPLGPILFLATRTGTLRRRSLALLMAPQLWGAALLAGVLFSPVVIWNAQNGWASFLFQGTARMSEATGASQTLASYLFQVAMLGLTGAPALAWALKAALPRWREPGRGYLLACCLPFLALMVYVSTRRLIQINWPMPAYLTAAILIVGLWSDKEAAWTARARRWAAGAVLVPAGGLTATALLWLVGIVPLPALNMADDFNGWGPMGARALALRAGMERPERTFLAGHGYQAASELAYESRLPHLTLSNNVLGEEAKGYDFWTDLQELEAWDAVYVVYEEPRSNGGWRARTALDPARLEAAFEAVSEPEVLTVERYGAPLRRYTFYRCRGYRPPPPR